MRAERLVEPSVLMQVRVGNMVAILAMGVTERMVSKCRNRSPVVILTVYDVTRD